MTKNEQMEAAARKSQSAFIKNPLIEAAKDSFILTIATIFLPVAVLGFICRLFIFFFKAGYSWWNQLMDYLGYDVKF